MTKNEAWFCKNKDDRNGDTFKVHLLLASMKTSSSLHVLNYFYVMNQCIGNNVCDVIEEYGTQDFIIDRNL